ncbi:MAG: hypothetical protein EXS10_07225 [Phycisphaerales bacterium]|nr:hypothetical protein [Phycisphaerales bacterium]
MHGKRLFVIILGCFILASIGTTIFAWSVVGGVRNDAKVTSAQLRLVADSLVGYATEHHGFPLSATEFLAQSSDAQRAELEIALQHVQVEWSIDRSVQPILRVDGKPTLINALPAAAEELSRAAETIRTASPPPPQ